MVTTGNEAKNLSFNNHITKKIHHKGIEIQNDISIPVFPQLWEHCGVGAGGGELGSGCTRQYSSRVMDGLLQANF